MKKLRPWFQSKKVKVTINNIFYSKEDILTTDFSTKHQRWRLAPVIRWRSGPEEEPGTRRWDLRRGGWREGLGGWVGGRRGWGWLRSADRPWRQRGFLQTIHRKKRFTSFPSPAGMSLTKLLGRNNSVMTSRESLVVTSRLGTGNSRTFFYGVSLLVVLA